MSLLVGSVLAVAAVAVLAVVLLVLAGCHHCMDRPSDVDPSMSPSHQEIWRLQMRKYQREIEQACWDSGHKGLHGN